MPSAATRITAIASASRARRLRNQGTREPMPSRLSVARAIASGAGREAVADRAQRVDRRRAAGQLELAPQVADVDLDDVRARVEVVAPHGAEDLLARERLVGMAQEVGEQVELARGQAQLDAVARDLAAEQVELDPGGRQRRRVALDAACAGARARARPARRS